MTIPERARQIAELRQKLHDKVGNNTARFFRDRTEENFIGLCGELAFAYRYGLTIDDRLLAVGDGGIDFEILGVGSIDIKTARRPLYLLLKSDQASRAADVLVLARYRPTGIKFVGWEYGRELARCPSRDFGYGIVNHFKAAEELRGMVALEELFRRPAAEGLDL